MKTLLAAVLILLAFSANAAPPYDVDVTFSAPTPPGDTYELFLDDVSQGQVVVGLNSFPALIPAAGTYTFRVDATNGAGTTAGTPVVVTVSEIAMPGTTTITIQVACDPCVITVN